MPSAISDPIKDAALAAVRNLIDPVLGLLADCGVSMQELNQLLRERAVLQAAERMLRETGRVNKARISIITGLPRSEVSRVLETSDEARDPDRSQHPARRLLSAWYEDPRFLRSDGEPADLPIFGKSRSFEKLSHVYSGGAPVRAMLDELVRVGAVEVLPDQRVRPKGRIPALTGFSADSIAMLGERSRDFLNTLINNLRGESKSLFEATAAIDDADADAVSVFQREIAVQGTSFINAMDGLLARARRKTSAQQAGPGPKKRIGVTLYFFQDREHSNENTGPSQVGAARKNLRRRIRAAGRGKTGSPTSRRRRKEAKQ